MKEADHKTRKKTLSEEKGLRNLFLKPRIRWLQKGQNDQNALAEEKDAEKDQEDAKQTIEKDKRLQIVRKDQEGMTAEKSQKGQKERRCQKKQMVPSLKEARDRKEVQDTIEVADTTTAANRKRKKREIRQTEMKNKIHHGLYILISAGVLLLLNSCVGNTVYHASCTLPHQELDKRDTLFFSIDSLPSYSNLKMEVELRTQATYPYQKICLVVEQEWEQGEKRKDLLTLDMDWDKRFTSIFLTPTISAPITVNSHEGGGTIKIYHHMKRERLPGINDLGIRISHD